MREVDGRLEGDNTGCETTVELLMKRSVRVGGSLSLYIRCARRSKVLANAILGHLCGIKIFLSLRFREIAKCDIAHPRKQTLKEEMMTREVK